ncbi:hypothetical protein OG936_18320 [Streptomyces sp. NBC_00846]|uniref:hypothetical protein n=1 Tax=Streptomyces sp. NBC_00846 TaxID=2975849 RepID=UPI00386BD7C6|nr:hypothetical protein OG936_18320 [Streptomyces sp. NBC_00846]
MAEAEWQVRPGFQSFEIISRSLLAYQFWRPPRPARTGRPGATEYNDRSRPRCQHPAPATVMRMLREHDEQTATAPLEPTA